MGKHLNDMVNAQQLPLSTPVSNLNYQSPEMLNGAYDEKCDVWAIGVTVYFMMCGDLPFFGNDDNVIRFCIKNGHIFFR